MNQKAVMTMKVIKFDENPAAPSRRVPILPVLLAVCVVLGAGRTVLAQGAPISGTAAVSLSPNSFTVPTSNFFTVNLFADVTGLTGKCPANTGATQSVAVGAPANSICRTPSPSIPRAASSSPTAPTTASRFSIRTATFFDAWTQFGRPSGVFIAKDILYVSDSESKDADGYGHNPGVHRGIRIGSAKDGKVTSYIPDPAPTGGSSTAEGVAADSRGNVYGAEVGPKDLKKYAKK